MDAILFLIFAAIAVISAISLVLQTRPMSSALSLLGVMGALAALYLLLGGAFIAAAQLWVYAGAIMLLFVYVIMLLNAGKEQKTKRNLWVRYAGAPMLLAFVGLVASLVQTVAPKGVVIFGQFTSGGPVEIGRALFNTYLLPFEVTSVLILIAILGAIVLARTEID